MTEAPSLRECQRLPDETARLTYHLILVLASAIFLVLPFITTFNEFLTRVVINLGLDNLLRAWVVPIEVRMIAVILGFFSIAARVSESALYLSQGGTIIPVYISWNCVGWQSFILFAVTLITGLQGPYTRASKVETVILGILGTFLVNLLRMSMVCVVAYYLGQLPAVIFHDYGGTILILLWLFAFWYFAHGYLLEPSEQEEGETFQPAT